MTSLKTRDYTGHSESSLDEAIVNALQMADDHNYFEVIETLSSRFSDNKRHYQVTLTTFFD